MTAIRRIRFPRPRKPVEPSPTSTGPTDIVQRDDGLWSLGWHDDAPGPFESRRFAEQVAAQ
jgi:hypothetical protein